MLSMIEYVRSVILNIVLGSKSKYCGCYVVREREELNKVPLQKDIDECERLLCYLRNIKPKEAVVVAEAATTVTKPAVERIVSVKEAAIPLPRDDCDNFSFGKKAKQKKVKTATVSDGMSFS